MEPFQFGQNSRWMFYTPTRFETNILFSLMWRKYDRIHASECYGITGSSQSTSNESFNPLSAKILRENINIYLHFMSFLHTNKKQVAEIPPRVRRGPAYST